MNELEMRETTKTEFSLDTFRILIRLRNAIKIDLEIKKEELKKAKDSELGYLETSLQGEIKYAKRMIDEIDGRMEIWAGECDIENYTSSAFSDLAK